MKDNRRTSSPTFAGGDRVFACASRERSVNSRRICNRIAKRVRQNARRFIQPKLSSNMKTLRLLPLALLAFATVGAEELEKITQPGAITGTVNIAFNTRTRVDAKGKPEAGVKDVYDTALTVGKTTEFKGKVERQPLLTSSVLGREQAARPALLLAESGGHQSRKHDPEEDRRQMGRHRADQCRRRL